MSWKIDVAEDLGAQEIRDAFARIAASPAFRASPQLSAFLRFVVDATLSGQSERIKGYTIAVEALGRDEDFDPQTDPIVRVEAGRLRRALERYYAEIGAADPIAIELPRGSYVPVFSRRKIAADAPAARDGFKHMASALFRRASRPAAVIGLVALGAVLYNVVHAAFQLSDRSYAVAQSAPTAVARGPVHGFQPVGPFVYVEPFVFLGSSRGWNVPLARMRDKLTDALARFDEINVLSDPVPNTAALVSNSSSVRKLSGDKLAVATPVHVDYRLEASAESPKDGIVTLMFRLVDTDDGMIVWSRTFDHLAIAVDPRDPEDTVIRDMATTLGQPFGIIHSHERVKRLDAHDGDPRYLCLLRTFEYWRDFDRDGRAAVRSCLERAVERDPTFALGFAALARFYFREYQFGTRPGKVSIPPLDRALDAARQAIRLKPNSVRAHRVLSDIYLARGDVPAALSAAAKALALNPYDLDTIVHYGAQLAALGDVDKAKAMLREATFFGLVRPLRLDFDLFLIAYLSGDIEGARTYARELPSDGFALGLMARALLSQKTGDSEGARRAIAQLITRQPAWHDDPRGELVKLFAGPPVIDKLAKDLGEAGLVATN